MDRLKTFVFRQNPSFLAQPEILSEKTPKPNFALLSALTPFLSFLSHVKTQRKKFSCNTFIFQTTFFLLLSAHSYSDSVQEILVSGERPPPQTGNDLYNSIDFSSQNRIRYSTTYSSTAYQMEQKAREEGRKECAKQVKIKATASCAALASKIQKKDLTRCNSYATANAAGGTTAGFVGAVAVASGPPGWVGGLLVLTIGWGAGGTVYFQTQCRDEANWAYRENLSRVCPEHADKSVQKYCYEN